MAHINGWNPEPPGLKTMLLFLKLNSMAKCMGFSFQGLFQEANMTCQRTPTRREVSLEYRCQKHRVREDCFRSPNQRGPNWQGPSPAPGTHHHSITGHGSESTALVPQSMGKAGPWQLCPREAGCLLLLNTDSLQKTFCPAKTLDVLSTALHLSPEPDVLCSVEVEIFLKCISIILWGRCLPSENHCYDLTYSIGHSAWQWVELSLKMNVEEKHAAGVPRGRGGAFPRNAWISHHSLGHIV